MSHNMSAIWTKTNMIQTNGGRQSMSPQEESSSLEQVNCNLYTNCGGETIEDREVFNSQENSVEPPFSPYEQECSPVIQSHYMSIYVNRGPPIDVSHHSMKQVKYHVNPDSVVPTCEQGIANYGDNDTHITMIIDPDSDVQNQIGQIGCSTSEEDILPRGDTSSQEASTANPVLFCDLTSDKGDSMNSSCSKLVKHNTNNDVVEDPYGTLSRKEKQRSFQAARRSTKVARLCFCHKSSCVKLYCECFSSGRVCSPECGCRNCRNTDVNFALKKRNDERFCNCRFSQCILNYCECFQANRRCTARCRCKECNNMDTLARARALGLRLLEPSLVPGVGSSEHAQYAAASNLTLQPARTISSQSMVDDPSTSTGTTSTRDIVHYRGGHHRLQQRRWKSQGKHLCPQCGLQFRLSRNLDRHTIAKACYLCPLCHKVFPTRTYLLDHIRQHTKEKPFKCHLCNDDARTENHLELHLRAHDRKAPHQCPQCTCSYCDPSSLARHMAVHESEARYRCPQYTCPFTFGRFASLTQHQPAHVRYPNLSVFRDLESTVPYKCSLCAAVFKRLRHLMHHFRVHATFDVTDDQFRCSVCDNTLATSDMPYHTRQRGSFQCIHCGRLFWSQCDMFVHAAKCMTTKMAEQQPADDSMAEATTTANGFMLLLEEFQSRSLLQNSNFSIPFHSCNECEISFSRETDLADHRAMHCTNLAPLLTVESGGCEGGDGVLRRPAHLCQECGKLFYYERYLSLHRRSNVC